MLLVKKIASILVLILLVFFSGGTTPPVEEVEAVKHPFVMVHGMGGWGDTSSINSYVSYWGATTGNLVEFLNQENYDCYAASVGPFSSAWDRACELYAQLSGTTVDYGVAHSQKFGHERFGRTYEQPLFEGWGQTDENDNLKKVNLYGHSFGGATVRLLTYLLENGCEEEISATAESEISPLFTGGKGDLVFSVTTLASPHNGTTLLYTLNERAVDSFITIFYTGIS
ncbi:MAG TPA: lipase, partial [Clostridia bacterium]|nr:lipase [Clostridia bacterium]